MRIGELSRAARIPASRIRFYEKAGVLIPDGRTEAGYRAYSESALETLRIIEQAQLAGFTLAEIKTLLPTGSGNWNKPSLLTALQRKLVAVEDAQRQLSRSKRHLRAAIQDIAATPPTAGCVPS